MPILLDCPNGHALRLKDKMAGKRGVCPKCGVEFTVPPAQAETPPLPNGVGPSADNSAVEWSAASAEGERLGPTVPTLFARWIAEGRVTADSLVWRTGWPEWRRAGDVAGELPAPLAATPARTPEASEIPGFSVPKRRPTAGSYAVRKRKQARQRRNFAVGLAVACLLLAGMLVVMIFR